MNGGLSLTLTLPPVKLDRRWIRRPLFGCFTSKQAIRGCDWVYGNGLVDECFSSILTVEKISPLSSLFLGRVVGGGKQKDDD